MNEFMRYTDKEFKEAQMFSVIFSDLSEDAKSMAIGYLSALRDKEVSDSVKLEKSTA